MAITRTWEDMFDLDKKILITHGDDFSFLKKLVLVSINEHQFSVKIKILFQNSIKIPSILL